MCNLLALGKGMQPSAAAPQIDAQLAIVVLARDAQSTTADLAHKKMISRLVPCANENARSTTKTIPRWRCKTCL